MPILSFIAQLTSIWHINVGESANKTPAIERRNVKALVEKCLTDGMSITEVADYVDDNALGYPLDTDFTPATADDAIRLSTLPGQLSIEDVATAFKPGDEFDDSTPYAELCHRIGTALNIDTSDDETNPDYWELAWHDGLTPYLAVTSSVDKPVTRHATPNPAEKQAQYIAGYNAYYGFTPYGNSPFNAETHHGSLVTAWENGWVDAAREDNHQWNQSADGVEVKRKG